MRWNCIAALLVSCGSPPVAKRDPPTPSAAAEQSAPTETTQPIRPTCAQLTRHVIGPIHVRGFEDRWITLAWPSTPPLGLVYIFDGDYFANQLRFFEHLSCAAPGWAGVTIGATRERNRELTSSPVRLRALMDAVDTAIAPFVSSVGQRAVGGFSYGALAALRLHLASPEHFSRLLLFSPSLWFGDRIVFREISRLPLDDTRIFLDVGQNEGRPGEVIPYMVADARRLVTLLPRHGYGNEQLMYRELPNLGHDMASVASRLDAALAFALHD